MAIAPVRREKLMKKMREIHLLTISHPILVCYPIKG
jgi:hypothetical protein